MLQKAGESEAEVFSRRAKLQVSVPVQKINSAFPLRHPTKKISITLFSLKEQAPLIRVLHWLTRAMTTTDEHKCV